jgi:hypothetical protein
MQSRRLGCNIVGMDFSPSYKVRPVQENRPSTLSAVLHPDSGCMGVHCSFVCAGLKSGVTIGTIPTELTQRQWSYSNLFIETFLQEVYAEP